MLCLENKQIFIIFVFSSCSGTPGSRGEPEKNKRDSASSKKSGASLLSSTDDEEESDDDSSDDESVTTLAKKVRDEMSGATKSSKKLEKSTRKVCKGFEYNLQKVCR
jgi:hypothetical protein